jgi:hypothetical protein
MHFLLVVSAPLEQTHTFCKSSFCTVYSEYEFCLPDKTHSSTLNFSEMFGLTGNSGCPWSGEVEHKFYLRAKETVKLFPGLHDSNLPLETSLVLFEYAIHVPVYTCTGSSSVLALIRNWVQYNVLVLDIGVSSRPSLEDCIAIHTLYTCVLRHKHST